MRGRYVGTVAYLVSQADAEWIVREIGRAHAEIPTSEFATQRPAVNDDSLAATLYWERDLMLSASIGAAFPTHDGLSMIKARNSANGLMQYMAEHNMVTLVEQLALRPWRCHKCLSVYWRTEDDAKRSDACLECLVLSTGVHPRGEGEHHGKHD